MMPVQGKRRHVDEETGQLVEGMFFLWPDFYRKETIILAQTTTTFLRTTSAKQIRPHSNSYKWRTHGLLPKSLAVHNLSSSQPFPRTIATQITRRGRTVMVQMNRWMRTRRAWQAHRVTRE